MRIETFYSHLNGYEWLEVRRKGFWTEIEQVIASIDASKFLTKVSKEKTMKGRLLYDPGTINKEFKWLLESAGWSESRVQYWVTDDAQLIRETLPLEPSEQHARILAQQKTPIRSYNQTDFVKERVAIEVQFGKYAFIAYDLFVKHLAFYVGDKIDCGIEILPMKSMQSVMSSGPGYYEGALYDLVRQGRGVPGVPLVLVGITP
ncbi:MAG: BglII/BstYI family type II restriction endonuclease [Pyrinomonadaceae bacterium]